MIININDLGDNQVNEERVIQSTLHTIQLLPEYEGNLILDIGGGGEGIIGKLYGNNVVSIDLRKEELIECDNESLKIVMDAKELQFLDNTFDTVTSFYTMMYMTRATQDKAISEVYRVLKPGGLFEIWDAQIPKYDGTIKDIFVSNLNINMPGREPICTGYGVLMDEFGQDEAAIKQIAISKGFKNFDCDREDGHFNLKFEK